MTSQSSSLVFVSGASGFIGSHIVLRLLQEGHAVRGSARGSKVEFLKRIFGKYDKFEAVEVADIAASDLSVALQGVTAVIHTASPLVGRADPETAFKTAIDGSLHILRESLKAGVEKVVVTGSIATYAEQGPFGAYDWNHLTKENTVKSGNPVLIYIAQKTVADQAVFAFAEQHPEIDITSLGPCFVFGPFVPGYEDLVDGPGSSALATNLFIYGLLRKDNDVWPFAVGGVDVRDVARAHVLALRSKPSSEVGRKRCLLIAPSSIPTSWGDLVKLIEKERPQLKDRLVDPSKAPSFDIQSAIPRDGLARAVGFSEDDYRPWHSTVLDTVDYLVELEKSWKAKGLL